MSRQLVLEIGLDDTATFASFLPAANGAAVACLRGVAEGGGDLQALVWGAAGSGKSHLLQAACRAAHVANGGSAYIPLASVSERGASILEGMAEREVVCIDDLDRVLGDESWEQALFGLINEARARRHRLVFAAGSAPAQLGVLLPDLESRLRWGPVFRLEPLDDQGKLLVLQRRASARGFELPVESARYLLTRYPRDLRGLLKLLDRIDTATLAAQRKATLPFIKSVLEGG